MVWAPGSLAAQRLRLLDGEHRRVLDRGRRDAKRFEAGEQGQAIDGHHPVTRVGARNLRGRGDAGEVDIEAAIH